MSGYDMIEAALQRAAELAPDDRRLRATLLGRASTSRSRRALLIVGGTLVAGAAATVVAVPLLSRGPRRGPATNHTIYPTGSAAGTGNSRAVMALRPGWLPDEVGEYTRTASLGSPEFSQMRAWKTEDFDPTRNKGRSVTLMVRPRRVAGWPGNGDPGVGSTPVEPGNSATPPVSVPPGDRFDNPANTSINGAKGWKDEPDGPGPRDKATVDWLLADDLIATIEILGVPDADTAVLRMANSVIVDGISVCEAPLRFGWLPSELPGDWLEVGAYTMSHDGTPVYSIRLDRTGTSGLQHSVTVVVGPHVYSSGGQRVTVRGQRGFCTYSENTFDNTATSQIVVQLDDGRWLNADIRGLDIARHHRDDAIHIVDDLWIGPDPKATWFGTR